MAIARHEWAELDLEVRLWSLPSQRTKSARPHEVPLSQAAVEIISSLLRRGPFVFTVDGNRPMAVHQRLVPGLVDRPALGLPRPESLTRRRANSASARPRTAAFAKASDEGFQVGGQQALNPDWRRVLLAAVPDRLEAPGVGSSARSERESLTDVQWC